VILVWGSVEDSPVARVIDELSAKAATFVHIDDNDLEHMSFNMTLGSPPEGWIEMKGRRMNISELKAIFLRPGNPLTARSARNAHVMLQLASVLPGVVLNRPAADLSNHSKAYQLDLISKSGFAIPPTLVTSDPVVAKKFLHRHNRLIYKSLSGVRSIIAIIDISRQDRLEEVRTGPVQLQKWIEGIDVRVHIVGEKWFACEIQSGAADYRYASVDGKAAELSNLEISTEVGRKIVRLAHYLNLPLAGVDLRRTPDDRWVCFEVNPSPGFPYYENATGQNIAGAIADYLIQDPL